MGWFTFKAKDERKDLRDQVKNGFLREKGEKLTDDEIFAAGLEKKISELQEENDRLKRELEEEKKERERDFFEIF